VLPDLGDPDEALPAKALLQEFLEQNLHQLLLVHVLQILTRGQQLLE